MSKKILISDIAKALGVSVTTVSFILNGKAKEKRISSAMTEKVLAYVKMVGYKPNELAKSLRTGKTHVIGLIVQNIANPFFANIAKHIENEAYGRGYRIIYCSTENNPEKTVEIIQMFRDQHVDGYIITPSEGLDNTIQSLLESKLPVVLFDRYLPNTPTSYVITNNSQAAFDATVHLAGQGFKKIALVTLQSSYTQLRDRAEGYSKAVNQHGIDPVIKKIDGGADEDAVIQDLYEFMSAEKPDALFFTTNYLAISGLKSIKYHDLAMPAMVSFDDHTLFKLFTPTITAVSQPIERLASEVINTLLDQMDGRGEVIKHVELPSTLIVRESSVKST